MPMRSIKPSVYSITSMHASVKNGTGQQAESSLEHDFLTILEFDPRVYRYGVQPITIHWKDKNGRPRRYTPDVLVIYSSYESLYGSGKPTLFEVKPSEVLKAKWDELRPKFKGAMGWAMENGYRFKLITEKQIRTPYLNNASFLLRYQQKFMPNNGGLDTARFHMIRQKLFELQNTTPRELLNSISSRPEYQAEILPWLWNLIGRPNIVGVDLHKPLTMSSRIWTLDRPETLDNGGIISDELMVSRTHHIFNR